MEVGIKVDLSKDNFFLMQLPNEVIDAFEAGETVFLRDSDSDHTVNLCTEDKTYAVRQITQSNTLLIVKPNTINEAIIESSISHPLEFIPIVGSLNLQRIPIYNQDAKSNEGITKAELESICPISLKELNQLCLEHFVFSLDQKYWRLDSYSVYKYLLRILDILDTHNLNIDITNFDIDKFMCYLPNDLNIFYCCVLKHFIHQSDNSLNVSGMVANIGLYLMETTAKEQLFGHTFLERWRSKISYGPGKDSCKLCELQGSFYTPTPGYIQFLDKYDLPTDPKTRFKVLFKLKSVWDLEEIEPYILDIKPSSSKTESFILKYARRQKLGTQVMVSSR